ncbi:MAG: phytoene desaturase family protein [Candidatus Baltobacteraceae bacterium]
MKSALVVGAGFAGLSAALHLARAGVEVEVLEAADRPGGRAQAWSSGEYHFDLGPTLVVMTDVLEQALGSERFAALELMRLEPGYEVRWPDGERFAMHSDIALSLAEFERLEPGVTPRALDYFARVHGAYRDARAQVLERDRSLLSFAAMLARPGRMRPWIAGPLRRFTERFFHATRLVEALTFQSLYLGTSPLRAPAMYALLPVVEAIEGVWFAPGGMASIVDAFVEAGRSLGVTFSYGKRVERIERTHGGVWRASTAEQTYEADAIVVAADREPSLALLGKHPPRFRAMRYGHSAFCLYLGVRRNVDLPYHTVLLPDDPWRAYAQLDRGTLPDDPLLYVYNPVARDASAAPADGSALLVLAPVPNLAALPEPKLDAFRKRIFARLEREVGELREFVDVERVRGPAEWASELGLMHGAAFGPDHGLDQMGAFRPPIVDRRFPGLAFAGSGTRPGSGVPMVVISGRLAAEHLLQR